MPNRIVFAAGVWDLFHIGHLRLLEKAAKLGDELHVGVLTDEAAEAYKGTPVIPYAERVEIVDALRIVERVWEVRDSNATEELSGFDPRYLVFVHGTDWKPGWEIGQTWVQGNGGVFVLLPYTETQSSTKIKELIIRRRDEYGSSND